LREAINIALLELSETGFLERLKQKWFYERRECTNAYRENSKSATMLNLHSVAGIFYILIIGLGLAMVIAFVEFLRKAKLDSTRLNQNICKVMRRNLRISIMGRSMKRNARPQTIATAMESPKSNDDAIVEESSKLNVEHTSYA
jgi:hypothetical protein